MTEFKDGIELAWMTTGNNRLFVGFGPFTEAAARFPHQPAFYAPDFFLNDPMPWKHPTTWQEMELEELLERYAGGGAQLPMLRWHPLVPQFFHQRFQQLAELISKNTLRKGVLLVFERGELASVDEGAFFSWLMRYANLSLPELFFYGMRSSSAGIVGATPELLFLRENCHQVTSMALAGTRFPRCTPAAFDELKEAMEHQLVVDDLEAVLMRFGEVRKGERYLAALGMLQHFRTDIGVELKRTYTFDDMVRALHPTGALGALPREAGMQWLLQQEKDVPRGRFGAPFGVEWPDGRARCLVAIRNIAWEGRQVRIGSGCGVVRGSMLEQEWDELHRKREWVKRNFHLL